MASDPFAVAAAEAPPDAAGLQQSQQGSEQLGSGHHPLEQAPSDDPFAPGSGGHPGGSASGEYWRVQSVHLQQWTRSPCASCLGDDCRDCCARDTVLKMN